MEPENHQATITADREGDQEEMPFALVQGSPVTEVPHDLYIPPDALEVILDAFEGPLDLLLYLIRRQNLDILDIPITEITRQYIEYIEMLEDMIAAATNEALRQVESESAAVMSKLTGGLGGLGGGLPF